MLARQINVWYNHAKQRSGHEDFHKRALRAANYDRYSRARAANHERKRTCRAARRSPSNMPRPSSARFPAQGCSSAAAAKRAVTCFRKAPMPSPRAISCARAKALSQRSRACPSPSIPVRARRAVKRFRSGARSIGISPDFAIPFPFPPSSRANFCRKNFIFYSYMYDRKTGENMSYRFETLQVHAGQEQPDPATGARAVPHLCRARLSCSATATARRRALRSKRAAIFTGG